MSGSNQNPKFALYHFVACPFCAVTRSALKHLDLDVEERDIRKQPHFRKELIQGGGKGQVPCLRIEEAGKVTWLYESQDIIRYLKQRAAA